MTQKLYYEDQYIKEFSAEVLKVLEKDNEFHIQLDKTAFYPGGGGQPCDIGTIEDSTITSVYEKDGIIYHVSNKKPIKIHKVKCKIDWSSRFDGMQQHLGQHILSAVFAELYNGNTIGFHLGKDSCTVDIDKMLSDEDLEKAELLSNRYVLEAVKVEFLTPTKAELKKMTLRKVPEIVSEPLRIVKIEDIDTNACCGLHPGSTIEVQLLKIVKKEKYKSGMRVEFLCGQRAVKDALSKNKFSKGLCKSLNCSEEEVLSRVDKLTSDLNSLMAENKTLKAQVADFEVENILRSCEAVKGIRIVKNLFENVDLKYVNLLASKLTSHENVIVLYGIKAESSANMLFMCTKELKSVSMNELLKDAISLIDGKGGGSSFSAQGGGKGINNLESAINYAFNKIKNILK
jgi:alanyl-tRNA synthetase